MMALIRLAALAMVCLAGGAQAQNAPAASPYPNRPVRIVVPFGPGGPTDVIARLIAQKLSESLGQQFYVENHGGAGGNIGMGLAANAAPDGHTLLFVSSSFVVNPSLYAKIPYDPLTSFAPVTLVASSPQVIIVHPSVPATSIRELIATIKANPGTNSFATPGTGTTAHLSGEMFRLALGLDLVHVPFNGAGPAIQSTVAGHTKILFTGLPPTVPHIKAGTLRALAVTAGKRSGAVPDVPTLTESGVPDQDSDVMQGVLVPAGTPKDIVATLNREIVRIVGLPDVKDRLAALGFEAVANTPDAFTQRIKDEVAKWGKVVRAANIKVE